MILRSVRTNRSAWRGCSSSMCIVGLSAAEFQTRDPDHLVQLLREALTGIADQAPEGCPISPIVPPRTDSEDPWLKHPQAAEYLGISKSTLYRYACQQTIESRKLGGRLEYHRSTLDRFKNRQIRPAV